MNTNLKRKTFYAIYNRQDSDRQQVRVIEADNIDAAWDLAMTLAPHLTAVEDIPPTGEVDFLDQNPGSYN